MDMARSGGSHVDDDGDDGDDDDGPKTLSFNKKEGSREIKS